MVSAILLAVCVVISALVWMSGDNGPKSSAAGIAVLVVSVLLGMTSITAVYFLKVRRSRDERMLDEGRYAAYEIVKDSITVSELPMSAQKDVMGDVLEMLLSAQKKGRSPEDTIGEPSKFAAAIVCAYAKPAKLALLMVLDGIFFFAFSVLLASFALWLEGAAPDIYSVRLDLSMLLLFFMLSFIAIPFAKKMTAGKRSWPFLLPLVFGIAFILAILLLRQYAHDVEAVVAFLDSTVRLLPNRFALAVAITAVPLSAVTKRLAVAAIIRKPGLNDN